MSTPDFNKVWGSNSSLAPYEFSDSEYLKGWESVGATPPARTQFDALQRNNDLKAQYLKYGLDEVKAAVQDDSRKPGTAYSVGDIIANKDLPSTYYLRCKVEGTTSDTSLVVPSDIEEGGTITDGTVVWEAFRLASNDDLQTFAVSSKKALAESTGFGIISGCEPSISGLTVTIGAGAVHLTDGARKETDLSTVNLDESLSNPRIDSVYLSADGTLTVQKGELGTAAIAGKSTYTITSNASTSDTVKICGITLVAGTDFSIGNDIATTAKNIVNTLNSNSDFSNSYLAVANASVITVTEKKAGSFHNPDVVMLQYSSATTSLVFTGNIAIAWAWVTKSAREKVSAPTPPSGAIPVCDVYVYQQNTHLTDKRMFIYNILEATQIETNKQAYKKGIPFNDVAGVCAATPSLNGCGGDIIDATANIGTNIIRISSPYYGSCAEFITFGNRAKNNNMKVIFLALSLSDLSNDANVTTYINNVTELANAIVNNNLLGTCYAIEILNEPNYSLSPEQYTKIVKQAYVAIKSVSEKINVMAFAVSYGCGLNDIGLWWLEVCGKNGIFDYMDIASVHAYATPDLPEGNVDKFALVKREIQQFSTHDIQIANSETGYSTFVTSEPDAPVATESDRAKYTVRNVLIGVASNVYPVMIFTAMTGEEWEEGNGGVPYIESFFGILNVNGSFKETSQKYSQLISELLNYNYVGVYYQSADSYILQFANSEGKMKYVGWSTESTSYVSVKDETYSLTDSPSVLPIIDNNITQQKWLIAPQKLNKGTYHYSTDSREIGRDNVIVGNKYSFANGVLNILAPTSIVTAEVISGDTSNSTVTVADSTGFAVADDISLLLPWNSIRKAKITAINGNVITIDNPSSVISIGYIVKSNLALTKTNAQSEAAAFCTGGNSVVTPLTLASGDRNVVSNYYSAALGVGINVSESGAVGVGKFNKLTTDGDRFIVGIGNDPTYRVNGLRVNTNGNTYGQAAWNSTGADYAEYFEWNDNNIDGEDRVGYFVAFAENNKIRIATKDDDYILGIVSGYPAILGNSYNDDWFDKYLKDDFGRIQYEDVEVAEVKDGNGNVIVPAHTEKRMKINPKYDNTQEYVGRENRKEWSAVGMLGVLPVRDDGTCEVNGYCKVADGGIATKADSGYRGYRVIERVSENVVKIVFR